MGVEGTVETTFPDPPLSLHTVPSFFSTSVVTARQPLLLPTQDSLLAPGKFPVRAGQIPCSRGREFAAREPNCPGNAAARTLPAAGFSKIPCYFPCSQGIGMATPPP
jgi:hypothetical protein